MNAPERRIRDRFPALDFDLSWWLLPLVFLAVALHFLHWLLVALLHLLAWLFAGYS